jgi:hypothetical protein
MGLSRLSFRVILSLAIPISNALRPADAGRAATTNSQQIKPWERSYFSASSVPD